MRTVVCLKDTKLWVAFGTGKHLRYIPAHDIAKELGSGRVPALSMFHTFIEICCGRVVSVGDFETGCSSSIPSCGT